jgi:hypothetical protein
MSARFRTTDLRPQILFIAFSAGPPNREAIPVAFDVLPICMRVVYSIREYVKPLATRRT